MINAATNASRIQITFDERVAGRFAAALALALAKATAFTLKFSRKAVEIGVLSLSVLGAGHEPRAATGGGISEANGLELSGICGPSDQFSKTATMRVRSASAGAQKDDILGDE